MIYIHLYIVVLFFKCGIIDCNYIDNGRRNCPLSDFCTRSKLRNFNLSHPYIPCCFPCSCEITCWTFDNCCPDILGQKPLDAVTAECKSSQFRFANKTVSEFYAKYHIVTSCPQRYSDTNLKQKCEMSHTHIPETYDDIVIVSEANAHDNIYYNKYCAACHGVMDVTRWMLKASGCIFDETTVGSQETNFILNNCYVYSEPDAITLSKKSECNPSIISTCNETGDWDRYDEDVERACIMSYYPYEDPIGNIVYRNVFCFQCNHHDGFESSDIICESDQLKRKRVLISFTAILDLGFNINEYTPKQVDPVSKECSEDEMFDSLMDVCRKIMCPATRSAFYGKCIPRSFVDSKLALAIQFRLFPLESVTVKEEILFYDKQTLEKTIELFRTYFSLNNCHFCYFTVIAFKKIDNDNLKAAYANIVIVITDDCKVEFVLQMFSKYAMSESYVNISINHLQISMKMSIDFSEVTNSDFWHHMFLPLDKYSRTILMDVTKDSESDCVATELEEMFFCPHLVLNMTEYQHYKTKTQIPRPQNESIMFTEATLLPGFYDLVSVNFSVGVCLDTYLKLTHNVSISSNGNNTDCKDFASLVLTIISMLCIVALLLLFFRNKTKWSVAKILIVLVACNLFIAQGLFQFGIGLSEFRGVCIVIGILIHYFWLSVMFAMNGYCILVFRKIMVLTPQPVISMRDVTFLCLLVYIYSTPLLFVSINITYSTVTSIQNNRSINIGYGSGNLCYINNEYMRGWTFALPLLIIMLVNSFIFTATVVRIRSFNNSSTFLNVERSYQRVYFKLSTLTGLTWVFAFLYEVLGYSVLEYLFIICNTGQGVFMLLAFAFGLPGEEMLCCKKKKPVSQINS